MLSRRATVLRNVVVVGLITYVGLSAVVLHYDPTIEFEQNSVDGRSKLNAADTRASTANRDERVDGPTPAFVVAALRLPLGAKDADSGPDGIDVPALLKRELSGSSSTKPTTTTKKPGVPGVPPAAARLDALPINMTLHKANMTDIKAAVDDKSDLGNLGKGHWKIPDVAVNPHPFKYILNNPNICRGRDIYILAYVHTAPDHYKRRIIIRQTWGSASNYDFNFRVVFVMGRTPNDDAGKAVQRALEFESEQYGDIIQEDFLDTYRNLTYKGIAALKWIDEQCSHARWILKTDDDIFVNTFNLLRHLRRLERLEAEEKAAALARHVTVPFNSTYSTSRLLMCLVWYNMIVMREGKWKVDKSDWPEDSYPTYCSGCAFVMSTDVAVALHRVSYSVPFFWVDDFYVTGLLARRAGPSAVRHSQFMSAYLLDGRQLADKFTGTQWYQYIYSHVHDLNAILSVWKQVVRIERGEVRPTIAYARPDQLAKLAEIAKKEAPTD